MTPPYPRSYSRARACVQFRREERKKKKKRKSRDANAILAPGSSPQSAQYFFVGSFQRLVLARHALYARLQIADEFSPRAESGTIMCSRGRIIHAADAPGDVARVCIFPSVHQPLVVVGISLNRARPERMNHKNSTEETHASPSIFLEPFSLSTWFLGCTMLRNFLNLLVGAEISPDGPRFFSSFFRSRLHEIVR